MEEKKTDYILMNTCHGDDNGHKCGYCNEKKSFSAGLTCEKMKCETYSALMDNGWRRCGTYYYKPNLFKSCCKMYTIRCDT